MSHVQSLLFVGPISSSGRDMAVAGRFMEGSRSPAFSQLNSDTNGIFSRQQDAFSRFEGQTLLCFLDQQNRWILSTLLTDASSIECLPNPFLAISGTDEIAHRLLARQEAHKRIIWACTWNPFGHEFATGSRDKTVKIWAVEGESSVKHISTLPQFSSSVTALSWVGLDREQNSGLLAVGMENGLIKLWAVRIRRPEGTEVPDVSVSLAAQLDPSMCHVSTVNRLAWRNGEKEEDSRTLQLASCGADQCVRVFEICTD